MQVILLEKIRNLGELGDRANVKPGYGRNYLIPRGKAAVANAKNKAEFEARRAELEKAQIVALGEAKARAEKMAGATVQIVRKVGEEGKLFGSVGTHDIVEAMTAAGFPLARAEIHMPEGPIKAVGDFEIPVSLHAEVHLKIIVSVVGEP